MGKQNCNQCENACPVDALRCGRGRRYFGLEEKEHGHRHGEPELTGPLGLLRQCGHMLHHGGGDSEDALAALTMDERKELERLLSLLLADWQTKAPRDAGGHHHGHHGG